MDKVLRRKPEVMILKCPSCGTVGTGNYCKLCGRILRCPSCGSSDINKFCGNCGQLVRSEIAATAIANESIIKKVNSFTISQMLPIAILLLAVATVSFYFYFNSSNPEENSKRTKNTATINIPAITDPNKSIYEKGIALIGSYNFEDALAEFKKITPSSPYYDKAQAKIDEILLPLAKSRLDKAKKLFEDKHFAAAYEELQLAYGTVSPPLQEVLDLLPQYEAMSAKEKAGNNPINVVITTGKKQTEDPYAYDDINARWPKLPAETTGFDWLSMTEKQKAYVITQVINAWKNEGKNVNKDVDWFMQQLDLLYQNTDKKRSIPNAMNVIAIAGMVFK